MSAKKLILPDAPLPLAIEDSPHWPIGRARAARDAAADWLSNRRWITKRPAVLERISKAKWEPSRHEPHLFAALRHEHDCRAFGPLRQLLLMARLVIALEQRESPPANLPLSSLVTQ